MSRFRVVAVARGVAYQQAAYNGSKDRCFCVLSLKCTGIVAPQQVIARLSSPHSPVYFRHQRNGLQHTEGAGSRMPHPAHEVR